ncbi:mitochondrial carrier domain-containing protein [Tuber borchii]|uniref:Mitochondrial carrier domain-containing protein n=1 Tax=Tuber borchii TaxID=42251 RepID=A0A2T7A6V9_TUBBO|nr:mitochondrial carrier domain-containing protein [Tuber borchii]
MSAAAAPGRSVGRGGKSDILHHPITRSVLPFLNGGAAGMIATSVIQPVDMVKVRIQLAGEGVGKGAIRPSAFKVAGDIIKQGKFLDLYSGLSAGLLRQAVYTTARMGFFTTFMNKITTSAKAEGRPVTFGERTLAALSAGGLGAVLGNPADLALIRMQSDGMRPLAERKNYTSVVNALRRIAGEEGVVALWNGCLPTLDLQRSRHLINAEVGRGIAASAVAGFFASFFSLPFDFVKTRLQKQTKGPDGKLPYKGSLDCAVKVAKEEGLLRFYRGFGTYYVRIAPHAMLTVLFADWFLKLTG